MAEDPGKKGVIKLISYRKNKVWESKERLQKTYTGENKVEREAAHETENGCKNLAWRRMKKQDSKKERMGNKFPSK